MREINICPNCGEIINTHKDKFRKETIAHFENWIKDRIDKWANKKDPKYISGNVSHNKIKKVGYFYIDKD